MNSENHFDNIAKDYEYWKQKNFYYYENLKRLYQEYIPKNRRVLEIGCGIGDILASLAPSFGYGIDISKEMIKRANLKYSGKKNIRFERANVLEIHQTLDFDFIVIADLLEHLEDPPSFFAHLVKVITPTVTIIISVANPFWEPLLLLAERLKLKMPEGPHRRLPIKENERIFIRGGLTILEKGHRLLIPKKIPGSDYINNNFYRHALLSRFGFIVYWVLRI